MKKWLKHDKQMKKRDKHMIKKMIKNDTWNVKKHEDDKINDKNNDECNDNQNDKKKWKKTFLTWPSLWLQVFHKTNHIFSSWLSKPTWPPSAPGRMGCPCYAMLRFTNMLQYVYHKHPTQKIHKPYWHYWYYSLNMFLTNLENYEATATPCMTNTMSINGLA